MACKGLDRLLPTVGCRVCVRWIPQPVTTGGTVLESSASSVERRIVSRLSGAYGDRDGYLADLPVPGSSCSRRDPDGNRSVPSCFARCEPMWQDVLDWVIRSGRRLALRSRRSGLGSALELAGLPRWRARFSFARPGEDSPRPQRMHIHAYLR